MLSLVTDLSHPLLEFIKDDPVRPELPREFRVGKNKFVSALVDELPSAIVCVSLHDFVPATVEDLRQVSEAPNTAIFYTIWSYRSGAARELLLATVREIRSRHPGISRFITLSPKTEMARKFHLKNGAIVLRENTDTVNYEYQQ